MVGERVDNMGYYVEVQEETLRIPAENFDKIAIRWRAMNAPMFNCLKEGGSFSPIKGESTYWYSWMPEDYDKELLDDNPAFVEYVLNHLGFEFDHDLDGSLVNFSYHSKIGAEDLFFEFVSELIEGYIVWCGEDGDKWMIEYGNYLPINYNVIETFEPIVRNETIVDEDQDLDLATKIITEDIDEGVKNDTDFINHVIDHVNVNVSRIKRYQDMRNNFKDATVNQVIDIVKPERKA
tara:strand:- start:1027 stop:1734 length:708 start_codon:yes stop_codon:yes gene_type:complete